jgi:hypothetical protein
MKSTRSILVGCCVLLAGCAVQSKTKTIYPAPSPDRVWFTGASNIRNFTCTSREVYVSSEAAPEDFERTRADGVPAVRNAALEVAVRSLDCGIGLQNSHLFETLKATDNPSITFALGRYVVEKPGPVPGIRFNGSLRIAGVERQVVLHGNVIRDRNGVLMLAGQREIDVTDFGVVPPKRFHGLLRVRKEVTVHFSVAVRPLIDPLGILTASLQ